MTTQYQIGYFRVLFSGRAADTDGADHLPFDNDGHSALESWNIAPLFATTGVPTGP